MMSPLLLEGVVEGRSSLVGKREGASGIDVLEEEVDGSCDEECKE